MPLVGIIMWLELWLSVCVVCDSNQPMLNWAMSPILPLKRDETGSFENGRSTRHGVLCSYVLVL